MSKQVDSFAKNAAKSFGLSETMAKKFTGTFGAMSKAFGFSEKEALGMATSLAGLSGDVASFYNLSQDEAYTKLKSVFTGETESLKDLGVVMTQSALDQYALTNGFGKTTAAMSEQEKVALRYGFVMDRLSLANGDFERTSGGWANQVRIAKLQLESFMATTGQGLINLFTPVIKVINSVIGRLMSLANAFKSFTEMVVGKQSSDSAASVAAVGEAAVAASEGISGTGTAAKEAAKQIKTATTGIDELNLFNVDGGEDAGVVGSGGGYAADTFDMGTVETPEPIDTSAADELGSKYDVLIGKAKELAGLTASGFRFGLGDTSVFESIGTSISGIKDSLFGIFTDGEISRSAGAFVETISSDFGRITGNITSIGASLADNLFGGLQRYLEQNAPQIKSFMLSMFDIGERLSNTYTEVSDFYSEVAEVFRGDTAKQITADIIGAFSNGFMGSMELAGRFGVDLLDLITKPFTENSGLFAQSFENTLVAIAPIVSDIKGIVDDFFTKAKQTYDQYFAPTFKSLSENFTGIMEKALELYNQYVVPILENIASKFSEFRNQHLQPLVDKVMEYFGKCAEWVGVLWDNYLAPFVEWMMGYLAPIISSAINGVVNAFFAFVNGVVDAVGGLITSLTGVIDFIIGVFTGDWDRAWTGIKEFFGGIWDTIKGILDATLGAIWAVIENDLKAIKEFWDGIWTGIKDFFGGIWDAISGTVSSAIENITTGIESKLEAIKEFWTNIWGTVKMVTEEIFGEMWSAIKNTINSVLAGIEWMVNGVIKGINKMIDALNGLSFDVPDWVPGIGGENFGFDISNIPKVSIPRLAEGGFVKANTPRLAMIGDNRHYGEIVAPEDKMLDMIQTAIRMTESERGTDTGTLQTIIVLLENILDAISGLDLTLNIDGKRLSDRLDSIKKRAGYNFDTA
jgi:phage-related protein